MMSFWNRGCEEEESSDNKDPNNKMMEDPLLKEDQLSATADESTLSSDDGDGVAVANLPRLEQDDRSTDDDASRRRQIPTLAWILVSTTLVFVGTFLAAAFMPPSPMPSADTPQSGGTPPNHTDSLRYDNDYKIVAAPTLLSIRDHEGGGPLNVHDHRLYDRIKHVSTTFHDPSDVSSSIMSKLKILVSDKAEIGHGDALTLDWSGRSHGDDEDILALYCPAGEEDPRRFRDVATLAQVRATHAHHNNDIKIKKSGEPETRESIWHIPSFPTVREESCEFRLYHHYTTDPTNHLEGNNEGGQRNQDDLERQQEQKQEKQRHFSYHFTADGATLEESKEEAEQQNQGNLKQQWEQEQKEQHHYSFVASTGPILLTSNKVPSEVHVGLTGKPSEVYIQFVTGATGESLVEIAKKSDVQHGRQLLQEGSRVKWTRVKGESTTYVAEDMCQAPATSTDPGFFANPGNLHTVRVSGLEPRVEYAYRAGLSFGQGIKWTDKYYVLRGPPPKGAGPPSEGKPALTFLALANQGCGESKYSTVMGADPPTLPEGAEEEKHPAQDVAHLVSSIADKQTIDSVHHLGNLAYADGASHVWEAYADMIQSYAAQVPILVGVGNHEYDHSDGGGGGKDPSGVMSMMGFQPSWGRGGFDSTGGECGVPVSKRFAAPEGGNGVFWYSYDQSLVHTVMLSTEHNMTVGSRQYVWLENDLAAVNRTVTPWLVVEMHRPMYNSELINWLNPIVSEGMQNEIEDLLRAHRVDLVLSGHYHSYFRSCAGLYSYRCDNGGPTYITVGTGGAPMDANTATLIPNDYTEHFQRERFGVGRATVYNATSMHWEFVAVGGNITDEVWLMSNARRSRR